MSKRYAYLSRKQASILGTYVNSTSKKEVLDFVNLCLDNKDKFILTTPNPEIILLAGEDWLLKRAIRHSDFVVPDGIGLAMANKFFKFKDHKGNIFRPLILLYQGLLVGASAIFNKEYLTRDLPIIKGRELFLDLLNIANERSLRVYLFGGEYGEQEKAKVVLESKYKNIVFKTHYKFPQYNKNAQPINKENRKLHKGVVGSIKLFEPDLIFVALGAPRQEKWIFRNFFRLKALGAMTVGGTFNFIAGTLPIPPAWMENIGLEWLWRLITEPSRWKRIYRAVVVFPWRVFLHKLRK